MVSLPRLLKSVAFPVDGCLAREHNLVRLREELAQLPSCNHCGRHMPEVHLENHRSMDRCEKAMDICLMRRDIEITERCGKIEFSLYSREGNTLVE